METRVRHQVFHQPDKTGHFGKFGGRYVGETLMPALAELEEAYHQIAKTRAFIEEYEHYARTYIGRPTPLYHARNLSNLVEMDVYLKREDLCHTGAHKVNNTLGQVLLAKKMGKKRIIAETGAGQHGVATATMCALFGLECEVFMGEEDIARQEPNVVRMKLLGAKVTPVSCGSKTLKDAMNEALRNWVTTVNSTFYCIGTVAGPHPYPLIVREFQSVIGREAREQILKRSGNLPEMLVACIGGGSNAMGLFHAFLNDEEVEMVGVEAAGNGLSSKKHAACLSKGSPGILHGNLTYILQNPDGQVLPAHSISAGLDYPGVGPEHAYLKEVGRVSYVGATDKDALDGFQTLARTEGIIPALESAHAIGYLLQLAKTGKRRGTSVIVNLSGRGDKDIYTAAKALRIK